MVAMMAMPADSSNQANCWSHPGGGWHSSGERSMLVAGCREFETSGPDRARPTCAGDRVGKAIHPSRQRERRARKSVCIYKHIHSIGTAQPHESFLLIRSVDQLRGDYKQTLRGPK
jgi:hypothetical protein